MSLQARGSGVFLHEAELLEDKGRALLISVPRATRTVFGPWDLSNHSRIQFNFRKILFLRKVGSWFDIVDIFIFYTFVLNILEVLTIN